MSKTTLGRKRVVAHTSVQSRILEAVRRFPGCQMDDLVERCPDLTWNQVFIEVDGLTRAGQLNLTSLGHGDYKLMLSKVKRKPELSTVARQK